jgi:hypothetical protein
LIGFHICVTEESLLMSFSIERYYLWSNMLCILFADIIRGALNASEHEITHLNAGLLFYLLLMSSFLVFNPILFAMYTSTFGTLCKNVYSGM